MIEPLALQPLPEAAEALRTDVRRFLDDALAGVAPDQRARSWLGFDAAFSRALGARGWIGLALPNEYGGGGRDAFARFVLVEELLARGAPLEGHSDNLAACLSGGVCLTWDGRIERLADRLPLTPVAVIPAEKMTTAESRLALPGEIPHGDAAYTVAHAALLGAGIARGDIALLSAAFGDRLHEPYRPSRILDDVRARPPAGAAGATLSGSGPAVIVWAEDSDACAAELAERFPNEEVLTLPVVADGAH